MKALRAALLAALLLLSIRPSAAAGGDGPAPPGRGGGKGFPLEALQDRITRLPFPGLDGASLDKVPLGVEADRLSWDDEAGVAEAEGDVAITFGDRTFRADRIRYDSRSGEALLEGDVRFGGPEGSFSFRRVRLSIPDGTGSLDNGTVDLGPGNYRISSERFEKTGAKTFVVRRGSFTTCPCDNGSSPDWSFGAGRLDVTVDGYAVGRHVVFRVRNHPVFWLPWAVFPAKVTRQSGLLLPVFSSSSAKGASLALPAYWAVNRWSDATLTVEGMTRRGVRPELEYRFVPNRESEGAVRGSWFHDTDRGTSPWRAWGENRLRVSDRLSLNAAWDTASSGEYYRDFTDEEILRKGRHVTSRGAVEDRGDGDLLALSFDLAKEAQIPSTPGGTPGRFPEAAETILTRTLPGGFDLRGEGATAYLTRSGPDGTGSDAEGRARGFAELSRPTRLGTYATLTPFAFLDALASRPSGADNGASWPWRFVPGAGGRVSTSLFRENRRPAGHSYVHTVLPSLSFRWTPAVDQSDIPLTDEWSRLTDRARFTFHVSQSLHRVERGERDPKELFTLDVEWAWDAGSRKGTGTPYLDPLSPFAVAQRDEIDAIAGRPPRERAGSDVLVQGRLLPRSGHRLEGEVLFDPVETTLTRAAAGYEYGRKGGNRGRLEYRLTRGLSEEAKGLLSWRVLPFLRLGAEADYSIRRSSLTEGTARAIYLPRSGCWDLGVVVRHTSIPKDTSAKVVFSLLGVGGTSEEE